MSITMLMRYKTTYLILMRYKTTYLNLFLYREIIYRIVFIIIFLLLICFKSLLKQEIFW